MSEREDIDMTIEIADKLVKLRKKHGYSQEELASKLGISRQAVSKWERAEASPDTDNLICLAKLYDVSLDELLATDEDIETIVEEQVKNKKDKVVISGKGIAFQDDEGQSVVVNKKGVCFVKEDGTVVTKKKTRLGIVTDIIEGALFILATIAFILLGSLAGMWYNGWIVFFIPEIICSVIRAIDKRNPHHFNMPMLAAFVFFFVCMVHPGLEAGLWHPMWVVFLVIPVYYILVSAIRRGMGIERDDHNECGGE